MFLQFFLIYGLMLFTSCDCYTNFYSNCTIAELVISIGIQTKEGNAEMKTHPVMIEITIRECLI